MNKSFSENFNDYLIILLQSSENFEIILTELIDLANQNKQKEIEKFINKFSMFTEDFIMQQAKTMPDLELKFHFVDRSFLLLRELKRIKKIFKLC